MWMDTWGRTGQTITPASYRHASNGKPFCQKLLGIKPEAHRDQWSSPVDLPGKS